MNVRLHLSHQSRVEVCAGLRLRVAVSKRVPLANICEKLKVGKLEERLIKFQKRAHYLVVNIERQSLVETVRLEPRDLHAHDLYAIVNTLDAEETLLEALGHRAVQHKVSVKLSTHFDIFLFDIECHVLRELCVERNQTQSIVEVSQSVAKARVAVFDHWRQ